MDLISVANYATAHWAIALASSTLLYFVISAIYNLYVGPLAKYPGPFFAKISSWPNFYHSLTGYRHIWIWQCHQIYGETFRYKPNGLLFDSPRAFRTIHGAKANVKRAKFYEFWSRNSKDVHTLSTVDPGVHARKRKVLNQAFSAQAIRSAEGFVVKHIDRWCELLIQDNDGEQWTEPQNLAHLVDHLTFDIMGDLSFGRSMDTKEPGSNPFKAIPHIIADYLQFMYPISNSPILSWWVWMKPRGLDAVFQLLTPPGVKAYYEFIESSVSKRKLEEEEFEKNGTEKGGGRKDMFHYLFKTRDEQGNPAYSTDELYAEANLLVIAGVDTTAIALCSFFFYMIRRPGCYSRLIKELRATFDSADEIQSGPKLSSCAYLQACVNEGMRLGSGGPADAPRVVLKGGLDINGDHLTEGTCVGVSSWTISHNESHYGDPWTYRPERWVVDEKAGVSPEDVTRAQEAFNPFLIGTGNCVGQKLAMMELLLVTAKTLYRMDVRQAPGDYLGGGSLEKGWGMRDPNHFQVKDAYVSLRDGPRVQFRKRVTK
ncbi:benzoate 4-monooxygenase cytochrome P450 [Amylocarpus encephaloides]|uniref:Benzoate 4-monooxygenase cytochrome P450 n=1 Tax=Amylocarpus encephaloides TaxID=45428 RepID=A0A9P7YQB2_9HELO|nr:benzoate 4-monooxygenase cytochrome P450 [Amylocarpus encephaloides]